MPTDADEARSLVKDDILDKYVKQINRCKEVAHMVPATVEVIKKLKNHILTHHNMFLTTDHDPLFYIIEAAKKLKDAIE
jgi:glucosamine 6-phosphate synthetase-like amidotransferase/phosphosugar isomerase protein